MHYLDIDDVAAQARMYWFLMNARYPDICNIDVFITPDGYVVFPYDL